MYSFVRMNSSFSSRRHHRHYYRPLCDQIRNYFDQDETDQESDHGENGTKHECSQTDTLHSSSSFDSTHSHPYRTSWNQTTIGGTVLSDPIFNKDIEIQYRPFSATNNKHSKTSFLQQNNRKILSSSSSSSLTNTSEMDTFDSLKSINSDKLSQPNDKMVSLSSTGQSSNNNNNIDETQRLVDVRSRLLFGDESSYDESDPENNKINKNNSCNWALYKGIFYSSLSSVFFSLSAVIVKYLKNIHPGQLAVSRFCGIFILTIPIIVYHDLNPFGPTELRPILIMRGIAGATSLFLRFVSFHYLPIADASVIIFSVPVFVSIFAWFYLKEPCGVFHTFTIMIAMIGLIMTTKLPVFFGGSDASLTMYPNSYFYYNHNGMNHALTYNISTHQNLTSTTLVNQSISAQTQRLNHLYGVITALSSLIFSSSVFIFIRKAKGAHYAVIMFNFGWVAIIETTIITSFLNGFSLPRTPFEWYLIVVLSIFSFCGQLLLTRSLQLEQAGPVSVVRATTDIALAFIWQLVIFKEVPDNWSIFGALVVSSCIVLTALRKWVISLPEHSIMKEKLYFLLI